MLLPSCVVYTQELIDSADGGSTEDGSGGSDEEGSGGAKPSGGTHNGSGGEDDDGTGGDDMSMGGTDPGSGGAEDPGSGGVGSGGGSSGGSGGSGTGGTPACSAASAPCVVDDLQHIGSSSYNRPPFSGKWDRYIQGPTDGAGLAKFTATSTNAMFVSDPAVSQNGLLHIAATDVDDWGLGMFVTLGGAQDISGYEGLSFKVRSGNSESVMNVALADDNSHRSPCTLINAGADCDKHMRSADAPTYAVGAAWTTIELPLAGFTDKQEDGVARTSDLNLRKVYSIHFQIRTEVATTVDFEIDDIVMY